MDTPRTSALVHCPTCGKDVQWVSAELFRPFCSERCKLIDLGEWATESYTIADSGSVEDLEDEGAFQRPTDKPTFFE